MTPREEWNNRWRFFYHFTGLAMNIYKEFKYGMGVDIYTDLLQYLITKENYPVKRRCHLPIYWGNDATGASCAIDFLIRDKIIVENYSQTEITKTERVHIQNLLKLTHCPYGMIMNFSPDQLYSEWYFRDPASGIIDKIKLIP